MKSPEELVNRSCRKVDAARKKLHRRIKGEFKDQRAERQFRGMVDFVSGWDDSKDLPIEDTLAIYAFRQRIEIRGTSMSIAGLLAALLVDGSSASKRVTWRRALDLVLGPSPVTTVDDVCRVGISRAGQVRSGNHGPGIRKAWQKLLASL